jgi:hypothetical protein
MEVVRDSQLPDALLSGANLSFRKSDRRCTAGHPLVTTRPSTSLVGGSRLNPAGIRAGVSGIRRSRDQRLAAAVSRVPVCSGRLKVMSWIVRLSLWAGGRRPPQGEGVADDFFLAPGN